MYEPNSSRTFEIIFRSSLIPHNIVLAGPHLPLPRVPLPQTPPPPPQPDPAQVADEERRRIEQLLSRLREVVEQMGSRCEALVGEMRQAAIELAVAVAGRLLFDKLQAGEFPIEEMVRQATARLPAAPAVTVYLHPDDLQLLRQRLEGDKETGRQGDKEKGFGDSFSLSPCLPVSLSSSVNIAADAALKRGGCRAEAGEIHVLADLAEQLAELRQHLLWSASHAQSEPAAAAS